MVGAVDNVAECGGISSIELDLGLILISADLVQFIINEALHRIEIHDMSDNLVVRVAENFGC